MTPRRALIAVIGILFLTMTGLGHGPGLVHGHVLRGGCGGNIPRDRPSAGCDFTLLGHQRIEFQTQGGLTLAATTTASDGSYFVVLPGGRYRILAPALTGVEASQLDVNEWWNQRLNICLCVQAP